MVIGTKPPPEGTVGWSTPDKTAVAAPATTKWGGACRARGDFF